MLLEGDLVEGGWQNRMLAASTLVRPGATSVLAARCVEQGRWHGQGQQHGHPAAGRYSVNAARRSADGLVDQGDVWRRIGRFEQLYGHTPSASLTEYRDVCRRRDCPARTASAA